MPKKREDLSGRVFERLTVLTYSHTASNKESHWNCEIVAVVTTTICRSSLILLAEPRATGKLATRTNNRIINNTRPSWNK